jgi:pSer/pThr/pTyr-binding forkhead associated (FHA) protein/Mg-chelatase subunit ChlD
MSGRTVIAALACLLAAATGAHGTQALDVVLVLDRSGSMKQNDPQRLMTQAATDLVLSLRSEDACGLISFGAAATALQPLGSLADPDQRSNLLAELDAFRYDDRFTNIALGIERGIYELRTNGRPSSVKILLFLTDGIMDTGNAARDRELRDWLRDHVLPEAVQRGVRVFSVALTEQADFMLLQQMAAATRGDYFRALSAQELASTFGQIRQQLAELGTAPAVTAAGSGPPAAEAASPATAGAGAVAADPGDAASGDAAPGGAAQPMGAEAPAEHLLETASSGSANAPEPRGALSPDAAASTDAAEPESRGGSWVLLGSAAVLLLGLVVAALRRGAARDNTPAPGSAAPEPASPATILMPAIPEAELVSLHSGERFTLERFPAQIGRDKTCDIPIPETTISRRHAQISYDGGRFYVEDLGSANGTSVNGDRIRSDRAPLADGDTLSFYKYRFKFVEAKGPEKTRIGRLNQLEQLLAQHESARAQSSPAPARAGTAVCAVHPEHEATAICAHCQKPGCQLCIEKVHDMPFCARCLGRLEVRRPPGVEGTQVVEVAEPAASRRHTPV